MNSIAMKNSISESFKANPITDLNNIIPLDFNNVLKLPESHTWSMSSSLVDDDPFSFEPAMVPVIDLNDPQAVELIRSACEKWGVFQVTNHGICMNLLDEIESQTRRLFALPANRKRLAARSPDGSTGYGLTRLSTFFSKHMWFEGFTIIGSPMEHATKLWPHDDHSKFCNVMEEYQRENEALSEKIISRILSSVGLSEEDLKWLKPKNGHAKSHAQDQAQAQALLQLNSYPVCPDPTRAMGLAAHTDSTVVTLIYQSNGCSGLQVPREDNETGWVPVHPIKGALVVLVGDLLHILSNGRFKSAVHRVVVNKTHHRISLSYFYGPPNDVKISPLIKMVNPGDPVLYRPVSWKEYLNAKAVNYDKALESIRLMKL